MRTSETRTQSAGSVAFPDRCSSSAYVPTSSSFWADPRRRRPLAGLSGSRVRAPSACGDPRHGGQRGPEVSSRATRGAMAITRRLDVNPPRVFEDLCGLVPHAQSSKLLLHLAPYPGDLPPRLGPPSPRVQMAGRRSARAGGVSDVESARGRGGRPVRRGVKASGRPDSPRSRPDPWIGVREERAIARRSEGRPHTTSTSRSSPGSSPRIPGT